MELNAGNPGTFLFIHSFRGISASAALSDNDMIVGTFYWNFDHNLVSYSFGDLILSIWTGGVLVFRCRV